MLKDVSKHHSIRDANFKTPRDSGDNILTIRRGRLREFLEAIKNERRELLLTRLGSPLGKNVVPYEETCNTKVSGYK